MEDENGKMYAKNCILDTMVTMTKNDSFFLEYIYLEKNYLYFFKQLDQIKKKYDKFKTLNLVK